MNAVIYTKTNSFMSDTFEVYVAYVVDHLADGKWSRDDWSDPIGMYSSKETIYKDINLNNNQYIYIQTHCFQKKYGTDLYLLSKCMEATNVPLVMTNNKEEMAQTNNLCVYWEHLEYNPITGKYFILNDDEDYYEV